MSKDRRGRGRHVPILGAIPRGRRVSVDEVTLRVLLPEIEKLAVTIQREVRSFVKNARILPSVRSASFYRRVSESLLLILRIPWIDIERTRNFILNQIFNILLRFNVLPHGVEVYVGKDGLPKYIYIGIDLLPLVKTGVPMPVNIIDLTSVFESVLPVFCRKFGRLDERFEERKARGEDVRTLVREFLYTNFDVLSELFTVVRGAIVERIRSYLLSRHTVPFELAHTHAEKIADKILEELRAELTNKISIWISKVDKLFNALAKALQERKSLMLVFSEGVSYIVDPSKLMILFIKPIAAEHMLRRENIRRGYFTLRFDVHVLDPIDNTSITITLILPLLMPWVYFPVAIHPSGARDVAFPISDILNVDVLEAFTSMGFIGVPTPSEVRELQQREVAEEVGKRVEEVAKEVESRVTGIREVERVEEHVFKSFRTTPLGIMEKTEFSEPPKSIRFTLRKCITCGKVFWYWDEDAVEYMFYMCLDFLLSTVMRNRSAEEVLELISTQWKYMCPECLAGLTQEARELPIPHYVPHTLLRDLIRSGFITLGPKGVEFINNLVKAAYEVLDKYFKKRIELDPGTAREIAGCLSAFDPKFRKFFEMIK